MYINMYLPVRYLEWWRHHGQLHGADRASWVWPMTNITQWSQISNNLRLYHQESHCFFTHSKFACSETTSYTNHIYSACTIPVWCNSVNLLVKGWSKAEERNLCLFSFCFLAFSFFFIFSFFSSRVHVTETTLGLLGGQFSVVKHLNEPRWVNE